MANKGRSINTFNPYKGKRSRVNALSKTSVRECAECALFKRMPVEDTVCGQCEVNSQDFVEE